jgi:MFS transporter, DHA2 family, multidrug resistance protein
MVTPYDRALQLPSVMGGWTLDTLPGLASLSKALSPQAAMIGYVNAFGMYTATSAGAIGPIMLARRRQRKTAA